MKPAHTVAAALAFLSMAATLTASVWDVQIYAVVERVTFEPNEKSPERIKIWGSFATLYSNQEPVLSGRETYAPRRGYLYFKLPPNKAAQAAAKKEWADLKAMAGTGQAIMFGSWPSAYFGTGPNSRSTNGYVSPYEETFRIYEEKERSVSAITYTMDTGIAKLPNQGKYAVLIRQLKEALQR